MDKALYTGIEKVYLIHHSHTDIGYTHDQPIVWNLHTRFIDTAIEECEKTIHRTGDDAFRWTVENTKVLQQWLLHATDAQVRRFVNLARSGRIEVTAMPFNITPLFDSGELIEALQNVNLLRRKLGIPIKYAMNSDVNGQNWPLVDVLLDAGIQGFSMATNIHFGGSPLTWPNAFHWQGPSGRSLLSWNGWDYGFAHDIGVDGNPENLATTHWPRIDNWLRERNYPLRILMLQLYDQFGDNGPASTTVSEFVRAWNADIKAPKLRLALPSEWWTAVREHEQELPTYRGDWTDYWNFGCGSSARETGINRESRARLRTADSAGIAAFTNSSEPRLDDARNRAWNALELWDEHTWGADRSISAPDSDDTASQWHHKSQYAYDARSLSLMLQRDAVAELAKRVSRLEEPGVLLFNPLPFERIASGALPQSAIGRVRGRWDDATAARHYADRHEAGRLSLADGNADSEELTILPPTTVPAFGYTTVPVSSLQQEAIQATQAETVETPHHRVSFNTRGGGIRSWYSQETGSDLVDEDSRWKFGQWVHESPDTRGLGLESPRRAFWAPVERRLGTARGWKPGWKARRTGPFKLLSHRVFRRDDGVAVVQKFELPRSRRLVQRYLIPYYASWIEQESIWEMGSETFPESTYVAFPFNLPDPEARLDIGGQVMHVERDQLPRACRDYFTVQNWVDLSNQKYGVTVACMDAPMVQLGGFNFGANLENVKLEDALLLGWVTNNYWETNFRAHQPGVVRARYRIQPHKEPFEESLAHKFAMEASYPIVPQSMLEPPITSKLLPPQGQLLRLPDEPVQTLHVLKRRDGKTHIRLLNASDTNARAEIGSGVLSILTADQCDLFGNPQHKLDVDDGTVSVDLPPRGFATVRLEIASK